MGVLVAGACPKKHKCIGHNMKGTGLSSCQDRLSDLKKTHVAGSYGIVWNSTIMYHISRPYRVLQPLCWCQMPMARSVQSPPSLPSLPPVTSTCVTLLRRTSVLGRKGRHESRNWTDSPRKWYMIRVFNMV